jgi:hypothetical protein
MKHIQEKVIFLNPFTSTNTPGAICSYYLLHVPSLLFVIGYILHVFCSVTEFDSVGVLPAH